MKVHDLKVQTLKLAAIGNTSLLWESDSTSERRKSL